MRNILLLGCFLNFFVYNLSSQDTIVVQTLTFDSITTRRGVWEFPTGESFRKILMVHTLKCDIQTTHDQYACGEWDYLTYNIVYRHTGVNDSILYHHPAFTYISGSAPDSVLLTEEPNYSYFNFHHAEVSYTDTLNYLEAEIGLGIETTYEVIPTQYPSGRSQYLWRAEELLAAGFSAGPISGIKLQTALLNPDIRHFMVRMKQVEMVEITPDTLLTDMDTVFFGSVYFTDFMQPGLNFYHPFMWNGVSNIVVDFSFTNPGADAETILSGDNPGYNCGISSGDENYAISLDGEMDFLMLPEDTYFNSDFTFQAWFFKRSNNNWSRIFDFGNGADINNVIVVLSKETSGKLSFHINNNIIDRSFEFPDVIPLNQWTHVTLRLTAHLGWLYINGNFVKIGLLQQPDNVNRSINYIGRSNWQNDGFADVLIDEFRIFKTALEPAEIKANFRQPLISPQADTNLIVYFNFDQGTGNTVQDNSAFNHHAACYGLPAWHRITGQERFMGFHQSNIRPLIKFIRLETSETQIEYETVVDSLANSPVQIILFENLNNPTTPTDTITRFRAGYTFVYDNYSIVDTIWIEPDEILYNEELPYYGEPFEVLEPFEIGRFITPYGINLSLGPQGFTWIFDVTDYAPLLQGQVDLSAGNQQELIDLKFVMFKGTPPRDVLKIDRIWGGLASYYYKDLDDDVVMQAKTLDLLPEASEFSVKTRLTGHGHNSSTGEYPHCCEWKDNEHYLMVNGEQVAAWHIFQYHDCGLNPVFPQGGTWPGAREGWCPGDRVADHDFEITEYINADQVTVDYDITSVPPDNLGMGWGNYVVNMDLIQYTASNFNVDAEIYDVVTPSSTDYYRRKNPVCYDPEIIVRNNGKSSLISLEFEYGVSGGIQQSYSWMGEIKPHCTDTIVLPVTFSSFWLGDSLHNFTVKLSNPNGLQDEYDANNSYTTQLKLPDFYDNPFIIQLKTNNQAYRYSLEVRDVLGNVKISRNNLDNNTVYRDTIGFTDGCYTLELIDQEDMGLAYWAYPEQGYGYLRFFDHDSVMIKNFNSDFGRSIFYTFNLGDVSYIAEPNLERIINIHPNPFTNEVFIDFEDGQESALVALYNLQGQTLYMQNVNLNSTRSIKLDLTDKPSGLYVVNVNYGNITIQKKIIKK
jgi:hypothetical protein